MTMRQLWPFPCGPGLPGGQQWQLSSLCEQDGFLFLRYRCR